MIKNLSQQFGNKKINKSQKTDLVQDVFTNVANKYDLMNDIMSFGTHRIWKKKLVDIINIQDREKILDVGCGTGDIGIEILKRKKNINVFLGDLNLSMIEMATPPFAVPSILLIKIPSIGKNLLNSSICFNPF